MHSRMFQLTKEPLIKSEWLTEEDIFDSGFIGSVADYVCTQNKDEREEDIKWLLMGNEKVIARKGNTLKIRRGAKHAYFSERYKCFLESVKDITIEDFCDDLKMWQLRETISDRFGLYVYADGVWSTFDTFIRESNEGDVYHVGGILDYHA